MKILQVITGMQKAAGTTVFVENVVQGINRAGDESDVVTSIDGLRPCDIIHIHGLWSPLLHKAFKYALKNDIPVVWSTHGMSSPWSMRHKRWKKWPAWVAYQKSDLQNAAAIHCTTDLEKAWNEALGLRRCFVVPLGTDCSHCSVRKDRSANKTLLFVGRIYPVKGLINLVKAWRLVVDERLERSCCLGWRLRIVGPDQAGHRAEIERLVSDLGLSSCVEFAGPRFGDDLDCEYDNCDCFVLPSFTENFGGVVVDALSHGKPCITSKFTPWHELAEYGCGWWTSNEPEPLAAVLNEALSLSDAERREMGERGRRLVEEKYTWKAVVKAMIVGYEDVLHAWA